MQLQRAAAKYSSALLIVYCCNRWRVSAFVVGAEQEFRRKVYFKLLHEYLFALLHSLYKGAMCSGSSGFSEDTVDYITTSYNCFDSSKMCSSFEHTASR
eukprot:15836-Heterococcus_DN1.PRE.2